MEWRPVKWRILLGTIAALALTMLGSTPGPAAASGSRACGTVDSVPIHAHKLSCSTARHIYRADMGGNLPSGWTCSASLARCYKGEVGSSHYLWWLRTNYQLTASVVLGGVVYGGPLGEGWALNARRRSSTAATRAASSQMCTGRAGADRSPGYGHHSVPKPSGGYYRPVIARLKAKRIGTCEGHRAYLKLLIHEPRRPGGPLRSWYS
jgi:hypothetical protein